MLPERGANINHSIFLNQSAIHHITRIRRWSQVSRNLQSNYCIWQGLCVITSTSKVSFRIKGFGGGGGGGGVDARRKMFSHSHIC